MTAIVSEIEQCTDYLLKTHLKNRPIPRVAVICGSGLSRLSESLKAETKLTVPYSSIPGFPSVGVVGHKNELVFGEIGTTEVAVLRGRFHSYEGHDMNTVVLAVRMFAKLGVKILIVTNAAGGIKPEFNVGDVMIISDHIGFPTLAGKGPLVGSNDDTLGPRFPSMSDAYSVRLRNLAFKTSKDLGMADFVKPKGTYFFVSGPSYETAAECAMIRLLGGDAVGMSTVPEVQAAKHAGMEILGLSLISNKSVLPGDMSSAPASHAEVLATTQMREKDMQRLVEEVIIRIERGDAERTTEEMPIQNTDNVAGVVRKLKNIDLSSMAPLDALKMLEELKLMVS